MVRKLISLLISLSFVFQQTGFAQVASNPDLSSMVSGMFAGQTHFRPLHLRSLSFDGVSGNFDMLADKGDAKDLSADKLKDSSAKLFEYFLTCLVLPNSVFWVNLRPDSPEQMIDPLLAQTDAGKVLLEADLQLKKDLARFTSPENPLGKEYWNKLYAKAETIFGSSGITLPTLTRPWIVPGEIILGENATGAYIYKAILDVKLEQDRMQGSSEYNFTDTRLKELNEYSSQLIRERILPALAKEVNSSARYSSLRQVYYSLILAQWFKKHFHGRAGAYSGRIDSQQLSGLTSRIPWNKETYFRAYKNSFDKGEYNVRETVTNESGNAVRSYFSGGAEFIHADNTINLPMAGVRHGPSIYEFAGNEAALQILGDKEAPAIIRDGGVFFDGEILALMKAIDNIVVPGERQDAPEVMDRVRIVREWLAKFLDSRPESVRLMLSHIIGNLANSRMDEKYMELLRIAFGKLGPVEGQRFIAELNAGSPQFDVAAIVRGLNANGNVQQFAGTGATRRSGTSEDRDRRDIGTDSFGSPMRIKDGGVVQQELAQKHGLSLDQVEALFALHQKNIDITLPLANGGVVSEEMAVEQLLSAFSEMAKSDEKPLSWIVDRYLEFTPVPEELTLQKFSIQARYIAIKEKAPPELNLVPTDQPGLNRLAGEIGFDREGIVKRLLAQGKSFKDAGQILRIIFNAAQVNGISLELAVKAYEEYAQAGANKAFGEWLESRSEELSRKTVLRALELAMSQIDELSGPKKADFDERYDTYRTIKDLGEIFASISNVMGRAETENIVRHDAPLKDVPVTFTVEAIPTYKISVKDYLADLEKKNGWAQMEKKGATVPSLFDAYVAYNTDGKVFVIAPSDFDQEHVIRSEIRELVAKYGVNKRLVAKLWGELKDFAAVEARLQQLAGTAVIRSSGTGEDRDRSDTGTDMFGSPFRLKDGGSFLAEAYTISDPVQAEIAKKVLAQLEFFDSGKDLVKEFDGKLPDQAQDMLEYLKIWKTKSLNDAVKVALEAKLGNVQVEYDDIFIALSLARSKGIKFHPSVEKMLNQIESYISRSLDRKTSAEEKVAFLRGEAAVKGKERLVAATIKVLSRFAQAPSSPYADDAAGFLDAYVRNVLESRGQMAIAFVKSLFRERFDREGIRQGRHLIFLLRAAEPLYKIAQRIAQINNFAYPDRIQSVYLTNMMIKGNDKQLVFESLDSQGAFKSTRMILVDTGYSGFMRLHMNDFAKMKSKDHAVGELLLNFDTSTLPEGYVAEYVDGFNFQLEDAGKSTLEKQQAIKELSYFLDEIFDYANLSPSKIEKKDGKAELVLVKNPNTRYVQICEKALDDFLDQKLPAAKPAKKQLSSLVQEVFSSDFVSGAELYERLAALEKQVVRMPNVTSLKAGDIVFTGSGSDKQRIWIVKNVEDQPNGRSGSYAVNLISADGQSQWHMLSFSKSLETYSEERYISSGNLDRLEAGKKDGGVSQENIPENLVKAIAGITALLQDVYGGGKVVRVDSGAKELAGEAISLQTGAQPVLYVAKGLDALELLRASYHLFQMKGLSSYDLEVINGGIRELESSQKDGGSKGDIDLREHRYRQYMGEGFGVLIDELKSIHQAGEKADSPEAIKRIEKAQASVEKFLDGHHGDVLNVLQYIQIWLGNPEQGKKFIPLVTTVYKKLNDRSRLELFDTGRATLSEGETYADQLSGLGIIWAIGEVDQVRSRINQIAQWKIEVRFMSEHQLACATAMKEWAQEMLKAPQKFQLESAKGSLASRSSADGGKGGIDLASVSMATMAMNQVPLAAEQLAAVDIAALQKQWTELRKQMRLGNTPYKELGDFLKTVKNGKGTGELMNVCAYCIAEVLRKEEESATRTSAEMKQVLASALN
jgi:hypothetical protein